MIQTAYVAHAVSGDVVNNIHRAKLWISFLIDTVPDVAFAAPWLTYLDVLDETEVADRECGVRDSAAMAARCHGIVLCSGKISAGMERELAAAKAANAWVINLSPYGALPPREFNVQAAQEIAGMFAAALRGEL